MPKKRRKLNKELEKEISSILKKVELYTALINDINEEDLLAEYVQAFQPAKITAITLDSEYKLNGDSELANKLYTQFNKEISNFDNEYEL